MKFRTIRLLIFVLGAFFAVGAGLRYWHVREANFFQSMSRSLRFSLLSIDGEIYDSTQSSKRPLQLLVFTPNGITSADLQSLKKFCVAFSARWGANVELLFVSRLDTEVLQNFRRSMVFSGRILNDPTGSSGRLFGFWENIQADDGWHYVLLDGAKKAFGWKYSSKQLLEFPGFEHLLNEALKH